MKRQPPNPTLSEILRHLRINRVLLEEVCKQRLEKKAANNPFDAMPVERKTLFLETLVDIRESFGKLENQKRRKYGHKRNQNKA